MGFRLVFFMASLGMGIALSAQHIHLDGEQFIDENGQPFYPMIMNYYVDYVYDEVLHGQLTDPDPSPSMIGNFKIAQASEFGQTGGNDYTNIDNGIIRVDQDLHELQAQGFNTIRLIIVVFKKPGVGFKVRMKGFPSGQNQFWMNMDPPYDPQLNPVTAFHFDNTLEVCSLANTLGMKVMLMIADGWEILDPNGTPSPAQDYANYLTELATFIHAHDVANLLAYEFYGEPTYADEKSEHPPANTKAAICEMATLWHHAVKTRDPDHLTTIGGVGHDDPFREGWDPMLLPVDFASMHFYPDINYYEYLQSPADYHAWAYERYMNKVLLYDRYIKKPWVISETGMAADGPVGGVAYPHISNGTEQDLDDLVRHSFPRIRSTRCAGYGWWLFQNQHGTDAPIGQPPYPHPLGYYEGRYFGILKFGNPTTPNYPNGITGYELRRKLSAQTFADWTISPPAPITLTEPSSSVDMNDRYYNPYLHPVNNIFYPDATSPTNYGTLTGQVEDQNGNPIVGAVLKAGTYVDWPDPSNVHSRVLYSYYGYGDDGGNFEIRAKDPLPGINNLGNPNHPNGDAFGLLKDQIIENLDIAAYGSAWVSTGWSGGTFQPNQTYELNSVSFGEDMVLDDIVVPAGISESYAGLASLTAFDVVVVGTADITAREEVDLKPEFHAMFNSETHVYLNPLCAVIETTDLRSLPADLTPVETHRDVASKEVTLDFHLSGAHVSVEVYPNPSKGHYRIALTGSEFQESSGKLVVISPSGSKVLEQNFSGPMMDINLSNEAIGSYSLILELPGGTQIRSLILN